MSVNNDMIKGYIYSDDMVSGIRMRSGLLVLLSSGAVALAFGASFYFALVSSQTAVATQFPELAPIVTKLKSLLVVNTIGFVGIIIASFWVLSRLLTSKMFVSLGVVMSGLRKAAENRYPESAQSCETGPFGEFEATWNTVVHETRTREKHEIEVMETSLASLSGPGAEETKAAIVKMIEEKKQRICEGSSGTEGKTSGGPDTDDALFMQPV